MDPKSHYEFVYGFKIGNALAGDADCRATLGRDCSVDIEVYDLITGQWMAVNSKDDHDRIVSFLYTNCSDGWAEYKHNCRTGWRAADRVLAAE